MMNKKSFDYLTPGLPDDFFIRGETPMTKEEVRVLTLSKLALPPKGNILDVGSGTGSISLEAARLMPGGMVYAVEKESSAVELLERNRLELRLENINIIKGEAPACFPQFPPLDGAVIGGSGGHLQGIIKGVKEFLKPGGRIVINALLLDTAYQGLQFLKEEGFSEVNIISVSIARGKEMGGRTALIALNPVFIIWGKKVGKGEP